MCELNFKRILRKAVALLCCSAVLALSVLPVPVSAATTDADIVDIDWAGVDPEKIIDIINTQHGVVASETVLRDVWTDYRDQVTGFLGLLDFTSSDVCDRDTFAANLEAVGASDVKKDILLNAYDVYCTDGTYSWLDRVDMYGDYGKAGFQRYLVGDGISKGQKYTIDAALSEDVMNCFDDYWSAKRGYYLIKTRKFSDYAQVSYFSHKEDYDAYCSFIETADNNIYAMMHPCGSSSFQYLSVFKYFTDCVYSPSVSVSSSGISWGNVYGLNTDWTTEGVTGVTVYYPYSNSSKADRLDTVDMSAITGPTGGSIKVYSGDFGVAYNYFVTKTGRNIKLWTSLDDFKNYSVGKQSVYYTSNYDASVYSPVTYTGDYYCDTSSTYNYSTVQNAIDNSVDSSTILTDSIVDSVVDNSVTNIVNNYYYTDPGTGGSSGSGGSSDSDGSDSSNPFNGIFEKLSEVLGNVVGVLDDIVALILSFIADALNGIVSIFTSVINMLTEFKDEVSGLGGALSEFFPYVPEEFWTIIMTTISVICGLAIIKYFTSK